MRDGKLVIIFFWAIISPSHYSEAYWCPSAASLLTKGVTKPRWVGPYQRILKMIMFSQAGMLQCLLGFPILRLWAISGFFIYTPFWFCDCPYILSPTFLFTYINQSWFLLLTTKAVEVTLESRSIIGWNKMDLRSIGLCSGSGCHYLLYGLLPKLPWPYLKMKMKIFNDCISA